MNTERKTKVRLSRRAVGQCLNPRRSIRDHAAIVFLIMFLAVWWGLSEGAPSYAQDKMGGSDAGKYMPPTETLIVTAGTIRNWPPHYNVDKSGQPGGFAIEIMNEVASLANVEVIYKVYDTFPLVTSALKAKEVDIIPNMGIAGFRKKFALFTEPVETFLVKVFVRSGTLTKEQRNADGLEILKGRRTAVVDTNVAQRILAEQNEVTAITYGNIHEAIVDLIAGRVDALAYPEAVVHRIVRSIGLAEKIEAAGTPLREIKRGIAIRDDYPELHQRLSAAVDHFVRSKKYGEIYTRWFGKEKPFWTQRHLILFIGIPGGVVLLLLVVWRYYSVTTLNRRLEESRKSLAALNIELESRVLERTKEIGREKERAEGYLNIAGTIIMALDQDGNLLLLNRKGREVLGYDKRNLIGRNWFELAIPEEQRAEMKAVFIKILNGELEPVENFENQIITRDGERRLVAWHNTYLRDEQGCIVGTLSAGEDITDRKENEARLEETRKLLTQSEKMAKFGYWICEHDTFTYPLWSDGLMSIYGLDPTGPEKFHKSALDPDQSGHDGKNEHQKSSDGASLDEMSLIHPDDRAEASEAFSRLVTKGEMLDCEYRIVLPGGEIKWLRDVGTVFDPGDGGCQRSYGTTQDITEQKNNEIRLEEINAFLAQSSHMSKIGHWVCEHQGFTYPYWSDGMDAIFGIDPETGAKATGGVPNLGNEGMTHPDDAERVQACFERMTIHGEPMDVEYRIMLPGNELRWVREVGLGIDYRDGQCWRSYGTTQDITERVLAEQSLRESLQMNETIFAGSPVGISIFDDAGQCISTNDVICDIIGATKEDIMAQNYHEIDSWKQSGLYEVALECLATGERAKHEMQTISTFGKQLFVECHLAPIEVRGRQHLLFMMTDMKDQKMLQAQLIQQSKMATLGEMATGVAHELNQPLNVIRMAVHNVLRKIGKNTVEPKYLNDKLERIDQQVDRATSIIDHMRVFGRRADVVPVRLDPREMVNGTMNLIGEQLRIDGVDVVIDMPEACPVIMGHQVQVEQVLLNLLGNARDQIEGHDGKKRINIAVTHDDHKVLIAVEDTGGGIPDDVLPRIFEPFFTTKEVGTGTGLGLSISYGIVVDMGGRIVAANTDHGARFTITLPVCEDDDTSTA
ncbi:MAG: PAS domain S-box protein [Rhodospirillales bacterium]|nr:PAS domain S-box protein [Rhodospirillales bacterium]